MVDASRLLARCAVRGAAALARRLELSIRTVQRWLQRKRECRPATQKRGPKPCCPSRAQRMALLETMREFGPRTGIDVLKAMHPEIPRRFIGGFKARWLRVLCRRYVPRPTRLRWTLPGRVWAMDFTRLGSQSPEADQYALVVRDCASRKVLAFELSGHEDQHVVKRVLERLFEAHGCPLVIKHDRGGGFMATMVQAYLAERQVLALISPARTPRYNGLVEAGMRSLKGYLSWHRRRLGLTGACTQRDLDLVAARANVAPRPLGRSGPSADDYFDARPCALEEERAALRAARAEAREQLLLTHAEDSATLGARADNLDAIERKSIERALVAAGQLTIRRDRFYTPNQLRKGAIY